jgi:hypothetical protein
MPDIEYVGVANETFVRSMLPWVGRGREKWLRAWSKPHPNDPGQTLVSAPIHRVYSERPLLQPITWDQLKQLGFPKEP